MAPSLSAVAFLAPDYDAAIAWFRDCLGFAVLEDQPLSPDKRWVVVGAPSGAGARFIVAKAVGEHQLAAVGEQAGGRVGYFLETDDFARDFARFTAKGVEFLESGRREAYGTVAVFKDPWGGKWDLIEPARTSQPLTLQRQISAVGGRPSASSRCSSTPWARGSPLSPPASPSATSSTRSPIVCNGPASAGLPPR